ncbi:hypothetical protein [Polaromonas sp. AET17H-212]|uniref:hypothetical protein n=1 Tax=Polaromonas sp. AET17H-212 TaxID=1977061 RepID=UPI00114158CB|nr:hypothetical protein [Polaromonas sp. AET17H-212]
MTQQYGDPYSIFEPYVPNKMAWLMFKVASYERLLGMQKGVLYMNSVSYFSTLEEAGPTALRKDPLEKTYAKFHAGTANGYTGKILIQLGDGEDKKTLDAGPAAVMSLEVPNPKSTMLFCMSALADDETGRMPSERDGKLYFDARFEEFGSHVLVIRNASVFAERVNKAIATNEIIYGGAYFQGGCGLVQYLDLENRSGHVGLFRKDKKYSWQQEYRICFGVKEHALNSGGAFELQIDGISDISQIISLRSLIENPVSISRKYARLVNGRYSVSDT